METASRQMPRRHERALLTMAEAPKQYDGRSAKIVEVLLDLEWSKVEVRDQKNPRKITVVITERGRYALERQRRGVDPYLRMTA